MKKTISKKRKRVIRATKNNKFKKSNKIKSLNKLNKNKLTKPQLTKLCKKYLVSHNGSISNIVENLINLRMEYLSKTEKRLLLPYVSPKYKNTVNYKIFLGILDKVPRVMPK